MIDIILVLDEKNNPFCHAGLIHHDVRGAIEELARASKEADVPLVIYVDKFDDENGELITLIASTNVFPSAQDIRAWNSVVEDVLRNTPVHLFKTFKIGQYLDLN